MATEYIDEIIVLGVPVAERIKKLEAEIRKLKKAVKNAPADNAEENSDGDSADVKE